MKKYYLYRLRSAYLIPIISLVIAILYIVSDLSYEYRDGNSGMYIASTIMGFCATLIPIFELYQFKFKKNLDTFFSLPLSRRKIAICHFLSGLTQLFIIYTLSYVFLFFHRLIFSNNVIFKYFLPHYFVVLALGILTYCVFCFAFYQANTLIDGIFFEILYIFLPGLFSQAITFVIDLVSSKYLSFYLFGDSIYSPIDSLTIMFERLAKPEFNSYVSSGIYPSMRMPFLIIWIIGCVAALLGFFITFERTKVEKIEGISDSPFGYKVLIPVCGVILANLIPMLNIIMVVSGYIIYRRGFKFKKSDYIVASTILVLSFLFEIL